jgi:hypothetical protein
VSGPYGAYSYADPTPSDQLLKDCRVEAKDVCKKIIGHGCGKVRRVRIEIDFTDNSGINFEECGP